MGVEQAKGAGDRPEDWANYVGEKISAREESSRRAEATERVKLYRTDYKAIIAWTLSQIFTEWEVYRRLERLLPIIGGASFLRRVANEVGRPLYAAPPTRRVILGPSGGDVGRAQEAYNAMAEEMQLNAQMDTVARMLTPSAAMFAFPRYVEDLGQMVLDVMTPDMVTVIPHPDVPTRALAIAYATEWMNGKATEHVVWDNARNFRVGPRSGYVRSSLKPSNFGLLPIVEIHQPGRTCHYWQDTFAEDLVSQAKQSLFMDCVIVRKVKTQSHRQTSYIGDSGNFVKGQVLDEESVIHAEAGTISVLDFESDPTKVLETKLANEANVAAAYGINRDRLNQRTTSPADDVGLKQRVAELAAVLVPAEVRLFEIVKTVSREHPKYAGHIPHDARLLVDLGDIHDRVDRMTQLNIREKERSMGYRSVVDDVLEDHPAIWDRATAEKFSVDKMAEEARFIEKRRALNVPADATVDEPGQDAAKNGAMGPKVRDGEMTRDEANEAARKGTPAKPDTPTE